MIIPWLRTDLKLLACDNCGAGDGGNLSYVDGAVVCKYCGHHHTSRNPPLAASDLREDIRLKAYAESFGYTVDCKRDKTHLVDGILSKYTDSRGKTHFSVTGDSWSFSKGNKHIWNCAENVACADLVDNHYCNHRYYRSIRIALDCEVAVDNGEKTYQEEKSIYFVAKEPEEVSEELEIQPLVHDLPTATWELFQTADGATGYVRENGLLFRIVQVAKRRAFYYGRNI